MAFPASAFRNPSFFNASSYSGLSRYCWSAFDFSIFSMNGLSLATSTVASAPVGRCRTSDSPAAASSAECACADHVIAHTHNTNRLITALRFKAQHIAQPPEKPLGQLAHSFIESLVTTLANRVRFQQERWEAEFR